ncbi:endospore germination permease [Geomicrobium sp. JSM 1781026]|uniref:GerAB/ArcD/ProY family transporter n=1 Tax=Geomicrobium sp. JSM 1781026 TaxID=3344580 RepID=UPI0035C0EAB7
MTTPTISSNQFRSIVIYTTCGTALLSLPTTLANIVSQDAWWIPLVSLLLGFPYVLLIILFGRWFPNDTFVIMLTRLFGTWFGKIAGVLFLLLPFLSAPHHLHFFTQFIMTHFFRDTPSIILTASFMAVVTVAVYRDIEVIGRASELTMFIFIFSVLLFSVFVIQDVDTSYLKPMFQNEPRTYVETILFMNSRIVAVHMIILLVLFPRNIQDKRKAEHALISGYIIACLLLFMTVFLSITILGPELTKIQLYTGFKLGQRVEIAGIIERLESFLYVIFFITLFFKLAIYLYATSFSFANIIGIRNHEPLAIPFGILITVLSMTEFKSMIDDSDFYFLGSLYLIVPIVYVIPALMLITGIIKRARAHQPIVPKHPSGATTRNHHDL